VRSSTASTSMLRCRMSPARSVGTGTRWRILAITVIWCVISFVRASLDVVETITVMEDEEDGRSNAKADFNFASNTAGAVVLDKYPPSAQGYSNLLNDDKDKYAICQCSEPKKWVVIGLSEDVRVTSVVVANYEKYSSTLKDFQILGSGKFPAKEWVNLGTYEASPRLGAQEFNISAPDRNSITRYIKFKFITHHGNQNLCTLSQIKVHGVTAIVSLHQEVIKHDDNMKNVFSALAEDLLSASASGDILGSADDNAASASTTLSTELNDSSSAVVAPAVLPESVEAAAAAAEQPAADEGSENADDSVSNILDAVVDLVDLVKPLITSVLDGINDDSSTFSDVAAPTVTQVSNSEVDSGVDNGSTVLEAHDSIECAADGGATVEDTASDGRSSRSSSPGASGEVVKLLVAEDGEDAGLVYRSDDILFRVEPMFNEIPVPSELRDSGAQEEVSALSASEELDVVGNIVVCEDMCNCGQLNNTPYCINICSNGDSTMSKTCIQITEDQSSRKGVAGTDILPVGGTQPKTPQYFAGHTTSTAEDSDVTLADSEAGLNSNDPVDTAVTDKKNSSSAVGGNGPTAATLVDVSTASECVLAEVKPGHKGDIPIFIEDIADIGVANSTVASASPGNGSGFQAAAFLANVCLDNVKYSDFKAKMEAKLSGLYSTGTGVGSDANSQDNVFRLLMQKIKMLEMNHAIIEMYVASVNECYRSLLVDILANGTAVATEVQSFSSMFNKSLAHQQHLSDELFDVLLHTIRLGGTSRDHDNISVAESALRKRLENVWNDHISRLGRVEIGSSAHFGPERVIHPPPRQISDTSNHFYSVQVPYASSILAEMSNIIGKQVTFRCSPTRKLTALNV
jgi:CDGSH-type Zn-finger protein